MTDSSPANVQGDASTSPQVFRTATRSHEKLEAAIQALKEETSRAGWSHKRVWVADMLHSPITENVLRAVIIFNLVVVVLETDGSAANGQQGPKSWIQYVNYFFSATYFLELLARFFVHRSKIFDDGGRICDFLIVMTDVLNIMLSLFVFSTGFSAISLLRIFRLARLSRALKVLSYFPVLYLFVRGLSSALKATFWGACFVAFSVMMWSILSVQILHPLNQEITKAGIYSKQGCTHCSQAWDSVWNSAVTITQHVIAGDAWGDVCIPMIKHAPYTLFMFMAMNFSINLLILNLILAIVVERANVSQQEDMKLHRLKADKEAAVAQARLMISLESADLNRNGALSKEELQHSFKSDADIAAQVMALGLSAKDVDALFELMDEKESGEISYQQVAQKLHNLKTHDSLQATLVMVRHMKEVKQILKKSICTTECLNSAASPSLQFQDALQHASLTGLFDSLSKIASSISDECTKIFTIIDATQLQSSQCHLKLSHPTSEVRPTLNQDHMVIASEAHVVNFTVHHEDGNTFEEQFHSPKENSPFPMFGGIGPQSGFPSCRFQEL